MKALVVFGEGFEEIEALTCVDVLDRAKIEVTTASVMPKTLEVKGAHKVTLRCDKCVEDCGNEVYDAVIVPGGMPGAQHCSDSKALITILEKQKAAGRWYCAICAAPGLVLGKNGLLNDVRATSYPYKTFQEMVPNLVADSHVVVDGKCITSMGPGTAMKFAMTIVEHLVDLKTRKHLEGAMVVH